MVYVGALFDHSQAAVRDAAAVSVSKMLLVAPQAFKALDDVIASLLGALPLVVDLEECQFTCSCLVKFCNAPQLFPSIQSHYIRILDIMSALVAKQTSSEKVLPRKVKLFVQSAATALKAKVAEGQSKPSS